MAIVNSFARFYEAVYPAESSVLQTEPTYGDSINVLNGTLVPSGDVPNYPSEQSVLDGVTYGTLGAEEFTGRYWSVPADKVEAGYMHGVDRLTPGTLEAMVFIVTPFFNPADFEIVRGDSYLGSRRIQWSDDGRWPDLSGATVKFGAWGDAELFEKPCAVEDGVVKLELTKEETAAFREWYRYDVQASLADAAVVTLASGRFRAAPTVTDIPVNEPLPGVPVP